MQPIAPERNTPLMREMLELRHEEGTLLDHPTYADMALVTKMARSPAEVLAFVRERPNAGLAQPVADTLRMFADVLRVRSLLGMWGKNDPRDGIARHVGGRLGRAEQFDEIAFCKRIGRQRGRADREPRAPGGLGRRGAGDGGIITGY